MRLNGLLGTPARIAGHRVRWFARFPGHPEDWTPRNRWMSLKSFGWDARCECGWETRTGGAIAARIDERIGEHLWDVAQENLENG